MADEQDAEAAVAAPPPDHQVAELPFTGAGRERAALDVPPERTEPLLAPIRDRVDAPRRERPAVDVDEGLQLGQILIGTGDDEVAKKTARVGGAGMTGSE